MLCISNIGQISLTRGDSFDIPFSISQGNSMDYDEYILGPDDEAYFAIMEPNQPWELAIIKKKYTSSDMIDGKINIHLRPEDTMCLYPGLYYYQIKVRIYDYATQSYIVNTILTKTQFWIGE